MTTRYGRRVALAILQGTIGVGLAGIVLALSGSPLGGAQATPPPTARPAEWEQRSRTFEQTGLSEPFKGITADGNVVPNLYASRSTGVSTAPVVDRRQGLPRRPVRTAAHEDPVRGRRSRMAQVDEPALLRAPGRRLRRDERGAAPGRVRLDEGIAEREGPDLDARHHAAESHARGVEQQRLRPVRRVVLLDDGDGDAVSDGALGVAARRPPRDHQLLRAGRSGGDDAELHRLGAGHRDVRQVRRHVGAAGRAEPRPGVHEQPRRRRAGQGHRRADQDRQQQPHRGLQGQRRARLPGRQGVRAAGGGAERARRPHWPVRRDHGRRARQGEDGGGEAAPCRDVFLVGRRDRRPTRSSTTASTAR